MSNVLKVFLEIWTHSDFDATPFKKVTQEE